MGRKRSSQPRRLIDVKMDEEIKASLIVKLQEAGLLLVVAGGMIKDEKISNRLYREGKRHLHAADALCKQITKKELLVKANAAFILDGLRIARWMLTRDQDKFLTDKRRAMLRMPKLGSFFTPSFCSSLKKLGKEAETLFLELLPKEN